MARSLRDKLEALEPERRARVEGEADRLHAEYLSLQAVRKARDLTQVQLAATLGVQQATVAKYERQSDLLISTLDSYVRAMGGKLNLVVEFPGREPITLEGIGDGDERTLARRSGSRIFRGNRKEGAAQARSDGIRRKER